MMSERGWVGMDVEEAQLDVYISSPEQVLTVANASPALAALVTPRRGSSCWRPLGDASNGRSTVA